MPRSANQKLKLLYLKRILEEQTDEDHPLTVGELIRELARYDIKAERKSIYDDIEALQQFGMDIIVNRGRSNSYFLGAREFELAELKLLVDAAQSAKFITEKKSAGLIHKIGGLASRHQAAALQRQVYVQGRVKTMNESIYYTVDILQTAITNGRKIRCRYFEWAVVQSGRKLFQRRFRHDGQEYVLSPWAMVWDNENYYLLAFDSAAGIIKHYRVDKLDSIEVLRAPRDGMQAFEKLDIAEYTKSRFGMFGGEEADVRLRFANRLIGVVVDRFGKDIVASPSGGGHFCVTVKAVVSPQFVSWVLGFGAEAEILGPPEAVAQLKATVEQVRGVYG